MKSLPEIVCQITGAQSVELGEVIQQLWSGYGVIQRAVLVPNAQSQDTARQASSTDQNVVIKNVDVSLPRDNRRGWGGDQSHQRKMRSYQVERFFYKRYSIQCDKDCKVPALIAAQEQDDHTGLVLILEDLDSAGFPVRKSTVDQKDIHACLTWLAYFHATFLGNTADELWPVGTYWHLATRPDELAAMPESGLKRAAHQIDQRLNSSKFQTVIHGDAKLANFCFSKLPNGPVAAVDFQYAGRGCGMKDVAYFISSCLSDHEAIAQQDELLGYYFRQLKSALISRNSNVDFAQLEQEWRDLYPFAWADFCRFLSGWSPGHWKLNSYTDQITQSVLEQLGFSDS